MCHVSSVVKTFSLVYPRSYQLAGMSNIATRAARQSSHNHVSRNDKGVQRFGGPIEPSFAEAFDVDVPSIKIKW